MVGALGSEAGFAGSMLNKVICMMHVLHYHKNPKLQLSGLKKKKKKTCSSKAQPICTVRSAIKCKLLYFFFRSQRNKTQAAFLCLKRSASCATTKIIRSSALQVTQLRNLRGLSFKLRSAHLCLYHTTKAVASTTLPSDELLHTQFETFFYV